MVFPLGGANLALKLPVFHSERKPARSSSPQAAGTTPCDIFPYRLF